MKKLITSIRAAIVKISFLILALVLLSRGTTNSQEINVLDFGASSGGKIDATASFQRALDSADKKGGVVTIPSGQFLIAGHLNVPTGVALEGSWRAPHHGIYNIGTVLLATGNRGNEEAQPLISLEQSSALRGVTIFYPEQSMDDLAAYPWAIHGHGMHVTIENVTLVNAWKGIDLGSEWNELHLVRNVYGCALKTGLYINNTTDIGRVENVHFNPHYWARSGSPNGPQESSPLWGKLLKHLSENAEAFVIGRSDWQSFLNTFNYGYKIGYHFIQTKEGVCNGSFVGIGSDANQYSVVVDNVSPIGLLITNGEFVANQGDETITVVVRSSNGGTVQFQNCAFWGNMDHIAKIEGNGKVNFFNCNFSNWARRNQNQAAIEALGGYLLVNGSNFNNSTLHILLGKDLATASISGNHFDGSEKIVNKSNGNVVKGFNSSNKKGFIDYMKMIMIYYFMTLGIVLTVALIVFGLKRMKARPVIN